MPGPPGAAALAQSRQPEGLEPAELGVLAAVDFSECGSEGRPPLGHWLPSWRSAAVGRLRCWEAGWGRRSLNSRNGSSVCDNERLSSSEAAGEGTARESSETAVRGLSWLRTVD
jgi:hypothetical protein